MGTLPFLPTPCPDEIFGSWLARLRLHNGFGAWRALLREAGYRPCSDVCDFDMPTYSIALDRLLKLIGVPSYKHALMELTTLPYWLSFDAVAPDTGTLSGTDLPLLGTGKGTVKSISAIANRYRAWVGVKFCPECLRDDFLAYGEPYWHRAHQLPNVTVCLTHQINLLTACTDCGRSATARHERIFLAPNLRCICGANLYLKREAVTDRVSNVTLRLARISRDALEASNPCYNRVEVREFLSSMIRSRDIRHVIEQAFPDYSVFSAEMPPPGSPTASWLWIRCPAHFSWLRAPDCCALLAAIGLEFTAVKESMINGSQRQLDHRERGRPRKTLAIGAAREEILRHKRNAPQAPASKVGASYWMLRLLDPDWLCQYFPKSRFTEPPSIQADRASIRRLMKRDSRLRKNSAYQWQLAAQSAAAHRAAVRDHIWYESQRRRYFDFSPADARPSMSPVSQTSHVQNLPVRRRYAAEIRSALQAALSEERKPLRPSVRELAMRTGLTYAIVRNTIRQEPNLADEMRSARSTFSRRRIEWAVQKLHKQNDHLTITAITSLAGVSRDGANSSIIRVYLSAKLVRASH